jgi:hypothetical protein
LKKTHVFAYRTCADQPFVVESRFQMRVSGEPFRPQVVSIPYAAPNCLRSRALLLQGMG